MKLVFASNNINKLEQVKLLLDNDKVLMPKDVGVEGFDVIEDGLTLKENAFKKANELYKLTKKRIFADDTGLFVKAIDNRPGIYAHRYAGENATDKDNRDKLLEELSDKNNRDAYFLTVICFIDEDGNDYYFEGRLDGTISETELGDGGFGYDKIFYVKEYKKSLGQMDINFKNQISHRGLAMKEFKKFLEENYENFNN
ncbi:RdgB/HAM1 family non-canonical purine NTP pyrophosphatase [Anaerococcus degeneri]|uniref:dITP/XTP pyrophosphatase n=1 Tax=Anaerococcus degeneri TaxID=361500 RepID=A0ABS7YZP7_9FIRM|nr:RdgB/HAM1 family non-canonical purine NTP pyrophosphatase [Anaerococcus degeneri]MBP2014986.1 XTP/dITP diphosphohydrolase [Anaerococcus degeneri]MCA2097194.1 RdgB/HAM1 family non-canonical purine NTP pyrophosphatase [Anaerococcus degeneri]